MKLRTLLLPVVAAGLLASGLAVSSTADSPATAAIVDLTFTLPHFGAGTHRDGGVAGTVNGVIDGVLYQNAAFTGKATYTSPTDSPSCFLNQTAVGTYRLGDINGIFDWTLAGPVMAFWIRLPDGTYIHDFAPFTTASPMVATCQQSVIGQARGPAIDDLYGY